METLIEEACRSSLIFVASGESMKCTPFHGLRRVREPVSRSKSGVQGKVADVFNARSRHAESLNELRAFRILLATAHADAWQEQTIYREIARLSPSEVMAARYSKRRADMEFRVSMTGPVTAHALERVVMDHTPSDLVVVDDNSILPLGRPTLTMALDEHTRCPMGFYAGFEPPSCLAVMRCLKNAILPKTYLSRQFPSIKNRWECYGVPELVVVDNPPEFHSSHFELTCLQIGCDIQ
jgi:putative transposase